MEFRDLLFDNKTTTFRIREEDTELYSSLFDKIESSISVMDEWKQLTLLKSEQKVDSHFSYIEEYDILLIREDAKDLLSDFLKKCKIEYLPCRTESDKYYILNHTHLIVDSIIEEYSEIQKSDQGTIIDITNIVFYPDLIENKPMFRIKEAPYITFVSEEFEDFYLANQLTGLDFSEDNLFIAADFV